MLCNHAPARIMDHAWPVGGFGCTGGGGVPVGRCRRRSALLGSTRARRGEDRHRRQILAERLVSPQPDQNFFNNEPINVALSQQELKAEESVTWHLNGKELDQPPTATQFVLPNPGRGIFAIAATITNQTTGEVESTPSVTFYVHEPSLLSPQHRNP